MIQRKGRPPRFPISHRKTKDFGHEFKGFRVCVEYESEEGKRVMRSRLTTRAKAVNLSALYHSVGHKTWIEDMVGGVEGEPKWLQDIIEKKR